MVIKQVIALVKEAHDAGYSKGFSDGLKESNNTGGFGTIVDDPWSNVYTLNRVFEIYKGGFEYVQTPQEQQDYYNHLLADMDPAGSC